MSEIGIDAVTLAYHESIIEEKDRRIRDLECKLADCMLANKEIGNINLIHTGRIRDLESQLAEAERILRLTCARVCGHDTGDQTLEFLKKEQSPELADIAIAIDLGMTTQFATARREAMEECQAIDPYNIVCPICSADIQVACQEGCSRFMRYRTAIRARLKELESG